MQVKLVGVQPVNFINKHGETINGTNIYAEATKDLKKSEIINFEDYFTKQMKANSVS